MLQPYALVSLTDFKDTLTVQGDAKNEVIERAISTASRLIEAELSRRLRYRAPEDRFQRGGTPARDESRVRYRSPENPRRPRRDESLGYRVWP